MALMKIIRDKNGRVINIGDWDYQVSLESDESGAQHEVIYNPMPDGAHEDVGDVLVGPDGGLYMADDPRLTGN